MFRNVKCPGQKYSLEATYYIIPSFHGFCLIDALYCLDTHTPLTHILELPDLSWRSDSMTLHRDHQIERELVC